MKRSVAVVVVAALAWSGAAVAEEGPAPARATEMSADGHVPPKIGLFEAAARKVQKLLEQGDAAGAEAYFLEMTESLSATSLFVSFVF